MEDLLVNMDDLETSDWDIFLNVTYNGKPFTGKAFDRTENFYSEYSFKNGLGHGKCFSIYSNGNKMEEFEMFEGTQIGEAFSWYDNGQLQELQSDQYVKRWSRQGVLWYEFFLKIGKQIHYYSTGEPMIEESTDETIYFSRSGSIFARLIDGEYYFDDIAFDEAFDVICYEYLLDPVLVYYLKYIVRVRRENGIALLKRMLAHERLVIQSTAINIIGLMKCNEFKQELKLRLNDHRIPPTQYDRYNNGPIVTYPSIAEIASRSLQML